MNATAHSPQGPPSAKSRARPRCSSSYLALCSALVFAGLALVSMPGRAQDERKFNITLPAAELSDALKQIAQQTGEDILFTADSVAGIRIQPLSGRMSARTAIQRLLSGTQLEVLPGGSDSLVVREKPPVARPSPKPVTPAPVEPVTP